MGTTEEQAASVVEPMEFLFTNTDVFFARLNQVKRNGEEFPIPLPKSLAESKNNNILFVWGMWYNLVPIIYKRLDQERKRTEKEFQEKIKGVFPKAMKARFRGGFFVSPGIPHNSSLTCFGCQKNNLFWIVHPWAAKILGLPEITTFPCPSNCAIECATIAYAEIAARLNGEKPNGE